jgi:DNA-binding response OmpR family regulator
MITSLNSFSSPEYNPPAMPKSLASSMARWYNAPAEKQSHPTESAQGPMRILVVDDDPPSVKMTAFLLREEGYEVLAANNGRDALLLMEREKPDLVLLDVMMPGLDGFETLREIRNRYAIPVIFLSAKGATADRVAGLEQGADDYLAKPFEPSELLARVKAVLRRTEAYALGDPSDRIEAAGIRLDPLTNRADLPSGRNVELTPIECRLLHCVMRNAGRVLTHDQLLNSVWGANYGGYPNQIAVYVRRLRTKIEEDPDNPEHLVTVRGVGYRFETY